MFGSSFFIGCWCKGNTALSKRANKSSILLHPAKGSFSTRLTVNQVTCTCVAVVGWFNSIRAHQFIGVSSNGLGKLSDTQ